MMNSSLKLKLVTETARRIAQRAISDGTKVATNYNYQTLKVTSPYEFVFHVELNRPESRNAMNPKFFDELKACFAQLSFDSDCRSVVLSGSGKGFTSGLDLKEATAIMNPCGDSDSDDVGRKGFALRKIVEHYQTSISSVEECQKPVIACVHGHCVGGGIDLMTACDIRYCSKDAWFSVKEVDIGLAADIGTLQRFPKVVGNDSLVRELVYTARKFTSDESQRLGLVSKVTENEETLLKEGLELARLIASKSPIAVQGSKINLIYSRDHSVKNGLNYMVSWNASMLQSEDVMKAAMSSMAKETPSFSKL
jgi:delta(3,5)-delta(2,4)-dienoyl-CoA isomerase